MTKCLVFNFAKPLRFARPLTKGTYIAVLDLSEIIPSVRFQVLFKSIKFYKISRTVISPLTPSPMGEGWGEVGSTRRGRGLLIIQQLGSRKIFT